MVAQISFILIVLMLLIYLYQSIRAGTKIDYSDPESFFLSKGAHSGEEYSQTQTAYFLQMATVYPFFIWGFYGQWWLAAWNTLFYAIGISLYSGFSGKRNQRFLQVARSSKTLHSAIADIHQNKILRPISSALTIAAFLGLTLFEIRWGSVVFESIFSGSRFVFYLMIALLAIYLLAFIWSGGQRATIKSDSVQLTVALIGLHLLVALMLTEHHELIQKTESPLFFIIMFLFLLYAIYRRLRTIKQDGTKTLRIFNLLIISSMTILSISIFLNINWQDLVSLSFGAALGLKIPSYHDYFGLLSLSLLPIFFQFVDLSNWQRLSSISSDSDETFFISAYKGLKAFLIESPLSWMMPIALGLGSVSFLAVNAGGDAWNTYIQHIIAANSGLRVVIVGIGLVGIVAIFLSTADSYLAAIGYAFAFDISKKSMTTVDALDPSDQRKGEELSEEEHRERQEVVNRGRYFVSIAVILIVSSFIVFDNVFSGLGDKLIGLFLSFFSPMLAFAPSLIVPLWSGRATSGFWAGFSILGGASVGILIGVASVFWPGNLIQWLPTIATFIVSFVSYGIGLLCVNRRVEFQA